MRVYERDREGEREREGESWENEIPRAAEKGEI